MCTIKDRNDRDLVEAEEMKITWKDYTEELFKKNILINWLTMMEWLVTQSQTFWSVKHCYQ